MRGKVEFYKVSQLWTIYAISSGTKDLRDVLRGRNLVFMCKCSL
jgi:hypothetical protein